MKRQSYTFSVSEDERSKRGHSYLIAQFRGGSIPLNVSSRKAKAVAERHLENDVLKKKRLRIETPLVHYEGTIDEQTDQTVKNAAMRSMVGVVDHKRKKIHLVPAQCFVMEGNVVKQRSELQLEENVDTVSELGSRRKKKSIQEKKTFQTNASNFALDSSALVVNPGADVQHMVARSGGLPDYNEETTATRKIYPLDAMVVRSIRDHLIDALDEAVGEGLSDARALEDLMGNRSDLPPFFRDAGRVVIACSKERKRKKLKSLLAYILLLRDQYVGKNRDNNARLVKKWPVELDLYIKETFMNRIVTEGRELYRWDKSAKAKLLNYGIIALLTFFGFELEMEVVTTAFRVTKKDARLHLRAVGCTLKRERRDDEDDDHARSRTQLYVLKAPLSIPQTNITG